MKLKAKRDTVIDIGEDTTIFSNGVGEINKDVTIELHIQDFEVVGEPFTEFKPSKADDNYNKPTKKDSVQTERELSEEWYKPTKPDTPKPVYEHFRKMADTPKLEKLDGDKIQNHDLANKINQLVDAINHIADIGKKDNK